MRQQLLHKTGVDMDPQAPPNNELYVDTLKSTSHYYINYPCQFTTIKDYQELTKDSILPLDAEHQYLAGRFKVKKIYFDSKKLIWLADAISDNDSYHVLAVKYLRVFNAKPPAKPTTKPKVKTKRKPRVKKQQA